MNYGTHLHPLVAAVLNTDGDVIEFGAGIYSTPILHEICKKQGRLLFTLESDKEWYQKFKGLSSDKHTVSFVSNWDDYTALQQVAVILIDHAREWRQPHIEQFIDCCEYMIVHDTDKMKYYGYNFKGIKYVYKYEGFKKTTHILSQYRDPAKLFE